MTPASNIERLFRLVAEGAPDSSIVLLDPEGTIISWTANAETIEGYASRDILGESVWRMWSTQDPPVPRQTLRSAETRRVELNGWRLRPDGERYWAEEVVTASRDAGGEVTGYVRFTRDGTSRHKAEIALRRSERRYRELFENANDIVYTHDLHGIIKSVNAVGEQLTGFSRDEWLGRSILELIVPEHRDRVQHMMSRKLEDGGNTRYTITILDTKGHRIPLEVSTRLIMEDGKPVGIQGIARDISERIRTQEAVRSRERYYRRLIEHASDAITVLGPDGMVRYSSPSLERAIGFGPEEREGRSVFELLHPDDVERAKDLFGLVSRTPEVPMRAVLRLRTKEGDWRYAEIVARNLLDDPVVCGVVLNTRDITEQRRLEEELQQAQKMEAIGRLAGGIAHDFNNLLTAIRGHTDLALQQLEGSNPARADLEEIALAADRASGLTRQLLAFSRRQLIQPRILEVDVVLVEMERLLRRLIGEHIELITRPGAPGARVSADRGQLEQVLMNLAVNARDAMPAGGRLVIHTERRRLESINQQQYADLKPGTYVCITVSDNGSGMDAQTLSRVFEPFFTTKEPGKGTGLGLATVYGILSQAGGHISVDSETGRGTTFEIVLPEARQVDETRSTESASMGEPAGGETVLLVEDEDAVRSLTSRILRKHGYMVLEASNGTEAVRVSETFGGLVHLLLTDVVMPKMSGREVAERLTSDRPGMRVLYMSGYTDDELLRHGVTDRTGTCFLEKPFTPDGLHRAIRDCLNQG